MHSLNTNDIIMKKTILLGHGSGGKMSGDLINSVFIKYFDNDILNKKTDSALLTINSENLAFTTDSYVVDPVFFPGGNIGMIAISGTVNDIAVSGAKPVYISAGFIIEEGFSLEDLIVICKSMKEEADKAVTILSNNVRKRLISNFYQVQYEGACLGQ